MDFFRTNADAPVFGTSATMHRLAWLLGLLSLVPLCIVLPMAPLKIGIAVIVGWIALLCIAISIARGHLHYMIPLWVAFFPYCYYYFSYPAERSIFTIDRAFIIVLVVEMLVVTRQSFKTPLTSDIRIAAYVWATYFIVCLVSLWAHSVPDVLGSYRLIFDGILMPALLGFYAMRVFPVIHNLAKIHAAVCILVLGIAVVAGTELFSSRNLFPWPGAVEEWVRTTDLKIIRVDGPFENSSVLCLVGTLGFFLIVYSRRLIGNALTNRQRFLHYIGVFAALASALMPMNRGLIIALCVCACIDYLAKESLISRSTWNFIFAVLLFFLVSGKLFYPAVYHDRVTSRDNFYQRIAQHQQTLEVIRDHPVLGVGVNLYHDTVVGDSHYDTQWGGFEALDYPHNSLLTVLAEAGVIGFALYVVAQLFLVRAMWRLRKVNRLGWQVFLYCVLVYTIFGLDVGIAYYSDLNLFYMFVLGTILQIQLYLFRAEASSNGSYGR
jgi:hypothetical protein